MSDRYRIYKVSIKREPVHGDDTKDKLRREPLGKLREFLTVLMSLMKKKKEFKDWRKYTKFLSIGNIIEK